MQSISSKDLEKITQFLYDQCWSQSRVPLEWKDATITAMPKPVRTLSLGALRPISLTSCMGKLSKRVI
ncbi:hypothetical protein HPB50_027260 [Hyalomma asiaticum]|uniref:Uncharacterized protein n=1 Tax=Hyalomma asiaticum TaxID=266040 RepID=A0ACB7STV6_HYAAI|nr:hypothetical protein HPB50_027260 [Hyalomma asiaticum]